MLYSNKISISFKKKKTLVLLLKILFFLISFLEIGFEYLNISFNLWLTKPFIIPTLILLYIITSKKCSRLYCAALFSIWLANIFFLFKDINILILGSILFMVYRSLILIEMLKEEKNIGLIPFLIGTIPFVFLFLSLINMIFDTVQKNQLLLIIIQCTLMSILGGLSLGSYFMKNNLSSRFLLISSLFFGINLFVLGVKFYFLDLPFLKPIAMIFFVLGQYIYYQYKLLVDE